MSGYFPRHQPLDLWPKAMSSRMASELWPNMEIFTAKAHRRPHLTEQTGTVLQSSMIDHAQIFTELTRRNAVRRHAQLPLLNMRAEYERAVEHAYWKVVCEQHGDEIRSAVIAELTRKFGGEPQSAGGRWAVAALTVKRLRTLIRP